MYDYRPYDPEAARSWIESAREASAEDAENALTWLTNIGSGAATGAATGAVAGPWGALVGALAGAGLGAAQTAMSQQQRPAAPRPAAPRPAAPRPAAPRPTPPRPPPPRPATPPAAAPRPAAPRPAVPPPVAASPPPAAAPATQSDLAGVLGAVLSLLPVVVSAFGQRQAEAIDEIDSVASDYSLEQAVEAAVLEALEAAESGDLSLDTQPVRERLPEVVTALAPVLPSVLLGMEPATTEARYTEWEQDGEGEFIVEDDEGMGVWPAEADDEQWTTPEWEAEVTA